VVLFGAAEITRWTRFIKANYFPFSLNILRTGRTDQRRTSAVQLREPAVSNLPYAGVLCVIALVLAGCNFQHQHGPYRTLAWRSAGPSQHAAGGQVHRLGRPGLLAPRPNLKAFCWGWPILSDWAKNGMAAEQIGW